MGFIPILCRCDCDEKITAIAVIQVHNIRNRGISLDFCPFSQKLQDYSLTKMVERLTGQGPQRKHYQDHHDIVV